MTVRGDCRHCGGAVDQERIAFRDECPHCGVALHACVQCAHYAPGRQYDCVEPNVEPVRDKALANRCDWFRFAGAKAVSSGGGLDRAAADKLLKDLFRKS